VTNILDHTRCDQCDALSPKEEDQLLNVPHRCKEAEGKILEHQGQHPHIPTPEWCPLAMSLHVLRNSLIFGIDYSFTEDSTGFFMAKIDQKTDKISVEEIKFHDLYKIPHNLRYGFYPPGIKRSQS
jgi:hypothetical protein